MSGRLVCRRRRGGHETECVVEGGRFGAGRGCRHCCGVRPGVVGGSVVTAAMGARVLGQRHQLKGAIDLLVLALLATHADPVGDVSITWDELADLAHVSRTTVFRVLTRLEEGGFIRRSEWRTSKKGASAYRLSSELASSSEGDVNHWGFKMKLSNRNPSPARVNRVTTRSGGRVVEDALSPEGGRQLVRAAMDEGWSGPASELLGRVAAFEARARLGWVARRRRAMGFDEAIEDLASRVWEAVREHADEIVEADSPWGLVTTIVVKRVARDDQTALAETAVDEVPERPAPLDYDHGVGVVLLEELLTFSWGGPHQVLVHKLVDYGLFKGLAWRGTRRLLEIAAGCSAAERITRARADADLASMGISPAAAGAWMSLIVGTRRGGPSSSFVLRIAAGGAGLTEDEARRFGVVAKELEPVKRRS